MANFEEVLAKRREKEKQEAVVYEEYGKRDVGKKPEEQHHYLPTAQKKQAPKERTWWFSKKKEAESKPEAESEPEPPAPPPKHRRVWEETVPIEYRVSNKDPDVVAQTKIIVAQLGVPQQVGVRIALLRKIKTGPEIYQTYLEALSIFRKGVNFRKVCRTGKIRKRHLEIDLNQFCITGRRLDAIPSSQVVDVTPGTLGSAEFRLCRRRFKNRKAVIQEKMPELQCAVLLTTLRTYSLIFDNPDLVDYLCAVVDLYKGVHGPQIWKTACESSPMIFDHPSMETEMY